MADTTASAASAAHGHAHGAKHEIPLWLLVATLVALLVLTYLTFAATWVDLGRGMNLLVAMVIATIKAILVGAYFMHLRYEKPIVHVILFTTLFFIALFLTAALFDRSHYEPYIAEFRAGDPLRPDEIAEAERRWAPTMYDLEQSRMMGKAAGGQQPADADSPAQQPSAPSGH